MNRIDAFSEYHPSVNFLFFTSVIAFTMFWQHPACRLISLICSAVYYCVLFKSAGKRFIIRFIIPIILLSSIMNPLLSHQGQTILFYLPSGNPFTLESFFYGMSSGVLLSAVMLWFFCLSAVMSTDKFIGLFAEKMPSFSLLLSMTVRFIPLFRKRFRETSDIMYAVQGGKLKLLSKIRLSLKCFISVLSHCLERGVETSDSMKSRGYGTAKRTAYKAYRLESHDKAALFFILSFSLFLICATAARFLSFRYYPDVSGEFHGIFTIMSLSAFFIICAMPVFLEWRERLKWMRLKSEI